MSEQQITMQSDTARLTRVLIKHARDAFVSQQRINQQATMLNYLSNPDFDEAVREYDDFANLLTRLGVTLEFLPANDTTTIDSIYCRDNSVTSNNGIVLCNMGKPLRATEPAEQKTFYLQKQIAILEDMPEDATLEGGDVAWLTNNLLAVGRGYRTNRQGINYLNEQLSSCTSEVIEVSLPHFRGPNDVLHLMSMISPITDDIAVVYSPLMSVSFRERLLDEGYQLIEVPEQEYDRLGCNILTIQPGVCVMVDSAPETAQKLTQLGIEVHTFKGTEICLKGSGGPTCLTRPLERLSS